MKIQAITYRSNYNSFAKSSENRMSNPAFGIYNPEIPDVDVNFDWKDMYIPKAPFSSQRQAIESTYGKKFAELADFAESAGLTSQEYEIRYNELKKEKERAIKSIEN